MDTDFRKAMRESESSGISNTLLELEDGRRMAGFYQFSDARLKDFKKETGKKFTRDEFLRDPALQKEVMDWHEGDIMKYVIDNGLDYYIGQNVGGVGIDPAALTGMAHLGGRLGMREFLETGGQYDPADKFGTKISDYGKKFSGLDMYGLTPSSPRPKLRPGTTSPRPKLRPIGLLD